MITTETLKDAAEQMYENITIDYMDNDGNPCWTIECPDPNEPDEECIIAELYCNTFDLYITGMYTIEPLSLVELYNEEEDIIRKHDAKELVKFIVDTIETEVRECVEYFDCILSDLK